MNFDLLDNIRSLEGQVADLQAELDEQRATAGFKLNSTQDVAVANGVFWEDDMTTCPRGAKVQLLSIHGVAVYGAYRGEAFWCAWAPLPRRKQK